jgi:methyltransferase
VTAAAVLLSAVTTERLLELWWARQNTAALLAKGGHEVASGHYPAIVLMHALWLGNLWIFGWASPVSFSWLSMFLALQGFRAWILLSLGSRWTTRIIVVPGEPLVKHGPYRFLSHPNYLVVAGEIATLPLCLGLSLLALAFSIANAVLLSVRIRAESAALDGSLNVEYL